MDREGSVRREAERLPEGRLARLELMRRVDRCPTIFSFGVGHLRDRCTRPAGHRGRCLMAPDDGSTHAWAEREADTHDND